MVIDPRGSATVSADRLHTKAGWTPFEGRLLEGRITATYLRGRLVAADGDLVSPEPAGRFLAPQPVSSEESARA